jgi:methylmalonyl-CoA mutase C-terminal domain/subunit
VMASLKSHGADDVLLFGGGIIPEDDVARLTAAGVARVFTPGTPLTEIVQWVGDHVKPREA